jgi:hypothetical protein
MSCIQLYTQAGGVKTNGFLNPFGLVLNALCVIGFAQILWHRSESNASTQSNMFKYLMAKAASDFFIFIGRTVGMLFLCDESCHLYATPAFTNWNIYLNTYALQNLFLFSSLMEAAATLGLLITKIFFIDYINQFKV